jgi:glycosyltransferase involved in cell wall biosynthesis
MTSKPARGTREAAAAAPAEKNARAPRVLFMGAFPRPDQRIFGGNASACAALMDSSFPSRAELILFDSAQPSPPPPFSRRAGAAFRRAGEFLSTLRTSRPDSMLVFCSSGFSFLEKAAYVRIARDRGVASVLFVRSGHFITLCRRSRVFRSLARRMLRFPYRIACQGESWRRFYEDELGVPPDRCVVIENWVATEEYLAVGAARTHAPSAEVRAVFMGRVERNKGIFELIEAIDRLVREGGSGPTIQLVIAGDGSDLEEARRDVSARGLEANIRFAGWVDGAEKLALFGSAGIFLLPSHAEGLPNAMIEAMATGLPVVVTPVGSVTDVVEDGVSGLVVPVGDPGALAIAIRRLVGDPELRSRMGGAGFRVARERFGAERAADRLIELLTRAARR